MLYFLLKYLHIIGASVLFGTGAGIAFFMLVAHRSGEASTIAAVARMVVMADFLFTATAVVLQPLTGLALAWASGYSVWQGWILFSILLYLLVGALWLPVVWMQIKLRDLALAAVHGHQQMPPQYYLLFRLWFAFGVPAFLAVLGIFWLMIAKPRVEFLE